MNDVFSREKRSEVMSLIRSRGNKRTELKMVFLLRKAHLSGWRRHLPLPGRPDFAYCKYKIAIFVDGCFWHGCPRCYRAPKNRADYWRNKMKNNKLRDRRVSRQLRNLGWRVFRIWEHEIAKSDKVPPRILRALTDARFETHR